MSEKKEKDAKPAKKGGGMLLKLGAVAALLAAGGGGAYGLVAAGIIGGGGHGDAHEDKNPKLILKGEEDPFEPVAAEGHGEEGGGGHDVDGEGGSKYRTAYFSFAEEFTSNLKESSALVQMSIACSTRRDYRVILWLKKHELALRSAILGVLADTPEEDVQLPAGKDKLQKRLTASINKVLTTNEGFGGVDAVYFKTFIVQ